MDQHKASGYDLITAKVLNRLPEAGISFLTQLLNAILWSGFIPPHWKVEQIIMSLKPAKCTEDVKSYQPISVLPIPLKTLEILFLKTFLRTLFLPIDPLLQKTN